MLSLLLLVQTLLGYALEKGVGERCFGATTTTANTATMTLIVIVIVSVIVAGIIVTAVVLPVVVLVVCPKMKEHKKQMESKQVCIHPEVQFPYLAELLCLSSRVVYPAGPSSRPHRREPHGGLVISSSVNRGKTNRNTPGGTKSLPSRKDYLSPHRNYLPGPSSRPHEPEPHGGLVTKSSVNRG